MGFLPKACANSAAVGVGIACERRSPNASWTLHDLESCVRHSVRCWPYMKSSSIWFFYRRLAEKQNKLQNHCSEHTAKRGDFKHIGTATTAKHGVFQKCCIGCWRGVALKTPQHMGLFRIMAQKYREMRDLQTSLHLKTQQNMAFK